MSKKIVLLFCAFLLLFLPLLALAGTEKKAEPEEKVKIIEKEKIVEVAPEKVNFKGRTLSILVNDTHVQVVDAWKPLWERETGGKINVILVPYAGISDKLWIDFRTKTGTIDTAAIPSTWLGDMAGGGHVVELDPLIAKYGYPDWEDVLPAIKVITKWAGKTVAFPYDGDNHMTYYRKDALEVPKYQDQFKKKYGYLYHMPPKDWDEVRDIAEFFNGWDWD
ncbi:MAG: extracellular solute-binding protein, partial [Spirochaetes bacterium]|nr:extracellular solute-binding protein [Spirochaetota bacterium]